MDSFEHFQTVRRQFPLLVPQNFRFTCFKGFIEINNQSILVKFKIPQFPKSAGIKIYTETFLFAKLSNYYQQIHKSTQEKTFCDFLNYFRDILETILKGYDLKPLTSLDKLMNFNQYIQIQNEMLKIAEDDSVVISAENNKVKMIIKDQSCREMNLIVLINVEYPNKCDFLSDDLTKEEIEFIKRSNNLIATYQNFLYCVQARENIWESLDEIDTHCWVVFPQNNALNELRRRIYLGNNIFCDISFSINESRPNIELVGPANKISRIGLEEFSDDNQSFEDSDMDDEFEIPKKAERNEWNLDCNTVENLLIQLRIKEFPKKPDFYPKQELNPLGACALCFEFDRDKLLPVLACPSERCANVFHRACLNESPGLGEGHDNSEYPCPLCGQLITNN